MSAILSRGDTLSYYAVDYIPATIICIYYS